MKTGRTLTELAETLQQQMDSKRDFIADTRQLRVHTQEETVIHVGSDKDFTVNDLAHEQIASRLQIPKQYYDRMRGSELGLLDYNINWLFDSARDKRMLRTIDGRLRAFLSERYRPLDNYDLMEVVLPIITKLGCKVESCELTDKRLYVKAVNERIESEVKQGDLVQAGIVISNSEVGCGSVRIEPMVYRLVCKNGMIANDMAMRKYHVGRAGSTEDAISIFLKDETRQADDKAFWMKVRDIVEGSLTESIFTQIVGKMKEAAGIEVAADPVKAVEELSKQHQLNKEEQSGVLKFLVQGGDLSLYGMMNAVTAASQEVEDYDRATELERLGGTLIGV